MTTDKQTNKLQKNQSIFRGKVVSDALEQSIVVQVDDRKAHPLYKKSYTHSKKYMVHDPKNEAKKDDVVQFEETRPFSRKKRWKLIKIVSH